MRHIPVPDDVEALYPEFERQIISPPDGDLTNPECRAADMLVGPIDFMGALRPCFRAFFTLEDGDLERLQAGAPIGLMFISNVVPPFSVNVL